MHDPQQPAEERRQPARQPVHRAEVQHAQAAVVEQPEVSRVRVRVQQPGPRGAGEQEPDEQDAGPVAVFLAAVTDDPGQRGPVHPLGNQYLVGAQHHVRHVDVRVARVGISEHLLGHRLELVVELLGDPVLQFLEQRLDVQPGHEQAEQPPGPGQLVEVADQRAARARVLDLHRDPPAVVPDGLVHLADGGRGGGRVAELGKEVPPVLPEFPGQHLVHGARGQRRRGFLEPGQRGPVRPRDLRRQRRLEDGQRLAQLHGAALELAQDAEDLLGRALLDLLRDDLGRPAADTLPHPDGRPTRQSDRQPCHLRSPGHRVLENVAHTDHCPA